MEYPLSVHHSQPEAHAERNRRLEIHKRNLEFLGISEGEFRERAARAGDADRDG